MALMLSTAAMAQRSITSTRLEVTAVLDQRPDPEAEKVVAPYRAAVDSIMKPVLGRSLIAMVKDRPESLLSNWAADVLVEFSPEVDGQKADMGVINVGGLRANMPEGDVTQGDILQISPFENRLCVVSLLGTDLLALFQDMAAVGGEGVSGEVRIRISPTGRLLSATVSGAPIDPQRTYRIATLDYLAEGNDRLYSFKKAQSIATSDILTREAMMRSVRHAGTISAQIEGRIIISDK